MLQSLAQGGFPSEFGKKWQEFLCANEQEFLCVDNSKAKL
jgi:hypothetical protein